MFAGRRPSPGGPFVGIAVTDTDWGPALDDIADRAFCSGISVVEHGYSLLVSAAIDEVVVADLTDPLTYFRGSYRSLVVAAASAAATVRWPTMEPAAPTVWLTTLGCAKNQVDSDKVTGMLTSAGYAEAASPEAADVVMVNTCGFIEPARRESVDTILDLAGAKTGRRQPRGHRMYGPALRTRACPRRCRRSTRSSGSTAIRNSSTGSTL